jgi:hypothetical protein
MRLNKMDYDGMIIAETCQSFGQPLVTLFISLNHFSECTYSDCHYYLCSEFKSYVKLMMKGQTEFCNYKGFRNLCYMHSKVCQNRECRVPFCSTFKFIKTLNFEQRAVIKQNTLSKK